MNDDDLRRLIAAEMPAHDSARHVEQRLEATLARDQQARVFRRAALALGLVAIALIVLSIGYWLAAMVLPPLAGGGLGALLWIPVIAPGALLLVALRSALLTLAEV